MFLFLKESTPSGSTKKRQADEKKELLDPVVGPPPKRKKIGRNDGTGEVSQVFC